MWASSFYQEARMPELTHELLNELRSELTDVQTRLRECTQNLPPRHQGMTMGNRNMPFVQKSLELAKKFRESVGPSVDMGAFEKDFTITMDVIAIETTVKQIAHLIDKVRKASGSVAVRESLKHYSFVKLMHQHKAKGMQAIYEQLRFRFARKPKIPLEQAATSV
jgi:hypothetical protein